MTVESEDYDIFLETWKPSEILEHATIDAYINDPFSRDRVLNDSTGNANLVRTASVPNTKKDITEDDKNSRKYIFFEEHHKEWSDHFKDLVLSAGICEAKFDTFEKALVNDWLDGKKQRHFSPDMLSIKASIRDHDNYFYPKNADLYVINTIDMDVSALFDPQEMSMIFDANQNLIETLIPNYLDALDNVIGGSINSLYLRRGVFMPEPQNNILKELHYLSSYSLSLSPVEQFAQTNPDPNGKSIIFSTPLPALQKRIVAFAPFIKDMKLNQLEFVVAPPIESFELTKEGSYGGILEYSYG